MIHDSPTDIEATATRLSERLRPFVADVSVGTGGSYPGLEGLLLSHGEASAAVRRGKGVNIGQRMTLAGLMIAAAPPGVRSLADDLLRPLREQDSSRNGELIETLICYMENGGSTSATAERLFVHRNTIGQRLTRIKELTGLDPSHPPHAAEFWLALSQN